MDGSGFSLVFMDTSASFFILYNLGLDQYLMCIYLLIICKLAASRRIDHPDFILH